MDKDGCRFKITNPKTGHSEFLPFDYDHSSRSFIARVIISHDPQISARVVDTILTKIDNNQDWKWFAGKYLLSAPTGAEAWRTSMARTIGNAKEDIMRRVQRQLKRPIDCIKEGLWIVPGHTAPPDGGILGDGSDMEHARPVRTRQTAAPGQQRRNPRRGASSSQSEADEPEYEVHTILEKGTDSRNGRSCIKYKIRWKGYGPSDDTWEWADNLTNAKAEIDEFEKSANITLQSPSMEPEPELDPGSPGMIHYTNLRVSRSKYWDQCKFILAEQVSRTRTMARRPQEGSRRTTTTFGIYPLNSHGV
jgi:hypothetical protein